MSEGRLVVWLMFALSVGVGGCKAPVPSATTEAFERNCARCHSAANLPGTRAQGLANPQKRAALDRFLAQHHAPDVEVRGQIIDYLATQEK